MDLEGNPTEIAKSLLPQLPRFSSVVSSPLKRCRHLAQELATLSDQPLVIEPAAAEINLGHWENRAWDDIPKPEIDAWADDIMDATPHGGESVTAFYARVTPLLRRLLDSHDPILLVAHNGTYRAALHLLGHTRAYQATLGYQCFEVLDRLERKSPQP